MRPLKADLSKVVNKMPEKTLDFIDLGIPIETLRKTRNLNSDLKCTGVNPFTLKIIIRTTGAGRLLRTYEEEQNQS
jgi:hypothetical protein